MSVPAAPGLIGAIEAGGTKFVLALARPDGTILARDRIATRRPEETFRDLRAFLDQNTATLGPLGALGIASFGPIAIDPARPDFGTILATTKPGWEGACYPRTLASYGVPIGIDSDVNGAALGEWRNGAGRGRQTIAYTTVGTGIGSGVAHKGRPLSGFSHYECGHIPVRRAPDRDPFAGVCRFHGDCLEGLASGPAIAARWAGSLSEFDDPQKTGLIADYLAQLAASLVFMHMPDRLIFGGGVMKSPGLIEALRQQAEPLLGGYLANPCLDPGLQDYIVLPGLGDDAGIAGAIELGLQAMGDRNG